MGRGCGRPHYGCDFSRGMEVARQPDRRCEQMKSTSDVSEIERLRLQYRPERVAVLFVGEAPPRGDSFFYRGHSGLTNYMRDALAGPKGDIEFLNWFKARGWYLDDLVTTPIENLRDRRKQCREARVESGEPNS